VGGPIASTLEAEEHYRRDSTVDNQQPQPWIKYSRPTPNPPLISLSFHVKTNPSDRETFILRIKL